MKIIFLFIFATIFSQKKAKNFLVTLDKEEVQELRDNSDIVEQDIEEEAKKNEADEKGVELKASDYSNSKKWAEVTFLDGGLLWECRYKTSRR